MTATAKRVQPEPPPARIVLEMDERDAGALRRVCDRVGGERTGPRGAMDRISQALDSAGVQCRGKFREGHVNSVYFADYW